MVNKEEQKLITGCIAGKPHCQKQLYLQYGPLIKGVCVRYAATTEEAEDLFQDIFVFILTHFNDYTHITSLKGWLHRIAVNKAVDYYRKSRRKEIVSLDESYSITEQTIAPIPEVLTMAQLVTFINELPEKRRIAFNLYVIDGIDQETICELMGETSTNVRTLISRAKESLRKRISAYLNHEEFEL